MTRIVIESPYAGDTENNVAFARAVCRWAVQRGYAPYASHLFFTQPGILDDNVLTERQTGIEAGLAWADAAEEAWMCLPVGDHLPSSGMQQAYERHRRAGRRVRLIRFEWDGRDVRWPRFYQNAEHREYEYAET